MSSSSSSSKLSTSRLISSSSPLVGVPDTKVGSTSMARELSSASVALGSSGRALSHRYQQVPERSEPRRPCASSTPDIFLSDGVQPYMCDTSVSWNHNACNLGLDVWLVPCHAWSHSGPSLSQDTSSLWVHIS